MMQREYLLNTDWQSSIEHKPIIYDLVEDLMRFFIIYPLLILINKYFELDSGVTLYARLFIIMAAMIAFTIDRRKAKRVYIFVLIQAMVLFLVAIVPMHLALKIEIMTVLLIFAISSLNKLFITIKLNKAKNDPSIKVGNEPFFTRLSLITGVSLIYFLYMASIVMGVTGMLFVCLFSLIILLSCNVVYTHNVGTFRLIESNKEHTAFTSKITRFNFIFAGSVAVFGIITGLLTYIFVYFTGLGKVDYFLLSYFHYRRYSSNPDPIPVEEESSLTDFFGNVGGDRWESSLFLQILEKIFIIFFWTIVAAILLVVFFIITRIALGFFRRFREHINEESKSVFSLGDISNDITRKLKHFKENIFLSGSKNNVKIRRLYYKLVKRYLAKGIRIAGTDSPTEIELKIESSSGSDLNDVTRIYHKARYSHTDSEEKDIEIIKTKFRQL